MKMKPLPTNDAIFLYFLSRRPPIAYTDLAKITPRLSPEGRQIASKILNNPNMRYRKEIPICTDMDRYEDVRQSIANILGVCHIYDGGSEAILGYLKYAGVLNRSGQFRRSA